MEKSRKTKFIIIITLMLAISVMSIGFSAFSATLNISSSANVTPNSADFDVKFYQSAISMHVVVENAPDKIIYSEETGGAVADSVILSSNTTALSGLNATFTEPGQSVTYMVYAGNTGQYDAYLINVNFANVSGASSNKVCTPGTGATATLVSAACDAISISVDIDGTTVTNTSQLNDHMLPLGSFEPISIIISYTSDGARSDGPFSVQFGDISFEYSTVDNQMITFTIQTRNGTSAIYYATPGMTWAEWIESEYNTLGVTSIDGCVALNKTGLYLNGRYPLSDSTQIEQGSLYIESKEAI